MDRALVAAIAKIVEEIGGASIPATAALEVRAKKDPSWLPEIIHLGCRTAVLEYQRDMRKVLLVARREVADEDEYSEAYRENMAKSCERLMRKSTALFDMPLPGGQRLGDATKLHLRAAAGAYYKRSKTNKAVGDFFSAVADLLPENDSVVREHLTEADIAKI